MLLHELKRVSAEGRGVGIGADVCRAAEGAPENSPVDSCGGAVHSAPSWRTSSKSSSLLASCVSVEKADWRSCSHCSRPLSLWMLYLTADFTAKTCFWNTHSIIFVAGLLTAPVFNLGELSSIWRRNVCPVHEVTKKTREVTQVIRKCGHLTTQCVLHQSRPKALDSTV